MLLSTRVKLVLLVWLVAETLAFAVVVQGVGVGGALLLGVITSLIGYSILRRTGAAAVSKLRGRLDRGARGGLNESFRDETLATVGAVALLVPGFLSDLVGLALAVPAVRDWIGVRLRRRGTTQRRSDRFAADRRGPARHGPETIDLDPEEWRAAEAARRPVPEA